ncbi:MAG: M15 family metallopeptidase, partial [Ignavibacterium sp.]|nr:M15 family metallopeptidase [Ignavibacterium sp.]
MKKYLKFHLSTLSFVLIISFSFCSTSKNSVELVDIHQLDPTIILDVRYATKNNFTGEVLYSTSKVYLIKEVAVQLIQANEYLKKNYGLRIKIYDGYRPLSVQKKMWEIMPDERYVANPAKGSRHNRGCAVDVTLVDSLGNELDMGT